MKSRLPRLSGLLIPATLIAALFTPAVAANAVAGLNLKIWNSTAANVASYSGGTLCSTSVAADVNASGDWSGLTDGNPCQIDNFYAQYTGFIQAPVTGTYTFRAIADDGFRLYVNNTLIIEDWEVQGPTTYNSDNATTFRTIDLVAGEYYPLEVQYFERDGGQEAHLYWEYPGQSIQLVPGSAYSTGVTISYDANGGTGAGPSNQTKEYGVDVTLADNAGDFTRLGYSLAGWNTQADGLGTAYALGGTYSANEAATLYAIWTPEDDNSAVFSGQGVSDSGNLIPSTGNFTVETWFKPANGNTMGLYSQGTSGSNRFFVQLQTDQSVSLYGTSAALNSPAGSVKIGAWNHLAFVYDGSATSMYIDGVLVASSSGTVQRGTGSTFFLGARYDGALDFSGEIDQFKVWDEALSPSEVAASMHSWQGTASSATLITHFDFNESDGTSIVYDRAGNSNLSMAVSRVPIKSVADLGAEKVVTFPRSYLTSVGGWTPPSGLTSLRALVVAGGGASDWADNTGWRSAGGGAGGFQDQTSVAVTGGTPYGIVVGQGGVRRFNGSTNGQDSEFSAMEDVSVGGGLGTVYANPGGNGGSGGGGSMGFGGATGGVVVLGGTGVAGQGYAGGSGAPATGSTSHYAAGGGGGAGGAGGDASSNTGGDAGIGMSSDITGSTVYYAGGGAGAGYLTHGTADTSKAAVAVGSAPVANSGSGGSGGVYISSGGIASSAGASGIVIVRYTVPTVPTAVTGLTAAQRLIDLDSDADSLTLSWDALTGHMPAVTSYSIEWDTDSSFSSGNTPVTVSGESSNSYTFNSLPDGQTYYFRIRATNSMGSGTVSSAVVSEPVSAEDFALDFDNTVSDPAASTFASSPDGTQIIPADGNFTVEAWINPDALAQRTDNFYTIVSQNQDSGGTNDGRFFLSLHERSANGRYEIHVGSESNDGTDMNYYVDMDDVIRPQEWTHIAVTSDATAQLWKLYVNGVLLYTSPANEFLSGTASNLAGFHIGSAGYRDANNPQWHYFNGQIDQVKVWGSALSDTQLVESMHSWGSADVTSAPSLLAHYDFNDFTAASTLKDQAGSFDLTINNAATSDLVSMVSVDTSITGQTTYTFDRSYLTETGGWSAPAASQRYQALIVGGGGGGGDSDSANFRTGGSGGAGGYFYTSGVRLAGTIPVVVGQGGLGAKGSRGVGAVGGDSSIGDLLVGGGGGGVSWNYTGSNASPGIGGANYVSGGSGGGGRSNNITGTGPGIYGGAGGSVAAGPITFQNQTFTGNAGVSGNDDGSDTGSGGLGGSLPQATRTSSITGTSLVYAKHGTYRTWEDLANGDRPQTYGSGGATNYNYGVAENVEGGSGASGVVILAAMDPAANRILEYNSTDTNSYDLAVDDSVTDLSGNGINATAMNTIGLDASTHAWNFTGGAQASTPYIDVDDIATSLLREQGFTVDFEADFGAVNPGERIFDFAESAGNTNDSILVYRQGTTNDLEVHLRVGSSSAHVCEAPNALLNQTGLHRYTISLDGATCKMYRDGTEILSTAFPYLPTEGIIYTSNYIGRSHWAEDNFTGQIRYIRFFRGAFTPSEIGAVEYKTVTLDASPGTVTDSSLITSGSVRLPEPTRAQYTNEGWYTDLADAGSKKTSPFTPSTDVTLSANWELSEYVVTWDSNGGSGVSDSTYPSGGTITKPSDPTLAGKVFVGWASTETSNQGDLDTRITSWPYDPPTDAALTLYAMWLDACVPSNTSTYLGTGTGLANLDQATYGSVGQGYREYEFTGLDRCAFTLPAGTSSIYALVVGGGGTGGWGNRSGGGGAGELLVTQDPISTSAGQVIVIDVGDGGDQISGSPAAGEDTILDSYTAFGGGRGAASSSGATAGGSGGGLSSCLINAAGGTNASLSTDRYANFLEFGFPGGDRESTSCSGNDGGGGGGAGGPGGDGGAGVGGDAKVVFGRVLAGGGAAYAQSGIVAGGAADGVTVGGTFNGASAGVDGTGSGAAANSTNTSGGSGLVVIRAAITTYAVTLTAGSSGSGSDLVISKPQGTTVTLPNSTDANARFIRAGYTVTGWSTSDGGSQDYAISATYSAEANATLYPVWQPDLPGTPSDLALGSNDTSVDLTWSASLSGGPVSDYVVEYQLRGASGWSTFNDGVSTSTSATVSGLTAGKLYNFRVIAANSTGSSSPSAVRTTITIDGLISLLDAGDSNSYSGSGSEWTDLTGNDNSVSGVNSPTFNSSGKFFDLNGTNQYFTYGTSSADKSKFHYDGVQPYTIVAFFSPDALTANPTRETLFSRWNGSVGGSFMLEVSDQGIIAQREAAPWRTSPVGTVANGGKYFSSYSFDGSNVDLYLDGELASQTAWGSIPSRPSVESLWGARNVSNTPSDFFDGKFYVAAIFDQAIDATQALALAQAFDTAPAAPTIDSVSTSAGTISVTFTAGQNDGTGIKTYQYSTDGGATWRDRATGTTASPLVITALSSDGSALNNGTAYPVRIRALNTLEGAQSNSFSATPLDLALTPAFGTPTPTADGFTVQVSNFDSNFSWAVSTTAGIASISGTGLITITGLTSQQSATVSVSNTRAGFNPGSGSLTSSAATTYTVTFSFNGGGVGGPLPVSASFTVGVSSPLVLPSPTKTRHLFGGWYSDAGLTSRVGDAGASYTPTAEVTLYAKWSPVSNRYADLTSVNPGSGSTGGESFKYAGGSLLPADRSSLTVEIWFREKAGTYASSGQNPILSQGLDGNGEFTIMAAGQGQDRQLYVWSDRTLASTGIPLSLDRWYHLAYTFSSGTYSVYLDGVLATSGTLPEGANVGNFYVGENAYYSAGSATQRHVFHGYLDQLKIWSRSLSPSEVQTSMHSWGSGGLSDLMHHYSFDDVSNPGSDEVGGKDLQLNGVGGGSTPVAYGSFNLAIRTPSAGLTGEVGTSYSLPAFAPGGDGVKTFSITSGTLPAGLSLNSANGLISGTPTVAGDESVVLTVTDEASGTQSTSAFTVSISAQLTNVGAPSVAATSQTLKSIDVSWTVVSNASSYTLKIYNAAGTILLDTISLANSLTSYTVTAASGSFETIADGTTYQLSLTAVGTGNYVTSDESAKSSVTTLASFAVTYNANGATSGTTPASQVKVEGVSLQLATNSGTLARTGYTFAGWNTQADGDGTDYAAGASYATDANLVLFAMWSPDTFTITYNYNGANGGTQPATDSYTNGGAAVALPTPTKSGYTFGGWYDNSGLTGTAVTSPYSPSADITLYAKWTGQTYTVNFSYYGADGGDSQASDTFTVGSGSPIVLPTPTKTGYTFAGWYAGAFATLAGAAGANYSPTQNLTLSAKWTAIQYTVTYNADIVVSGVTYSGSGDVPVDANTYTIGSTVPVLPNAQATPLTRLGYTFVGWVTNADGTGTALNSGQSLTMGSANVNLYPKWSANTYTISYNLNGGTGSLTGAPVSYTVGGNNVALPSSGFTKTGFDFIGWTKTQGSTTEISNSFSTFADVTLYAVWRLKNVSYTFDDGIADKSTLGITWPSNSSASFGSSITLPDLSGTLASVGADQYLFFGWSLSGVDYAPGASYTMGENTAAFVAEWVMVRDVRYSFNGGTHSGSGNQDAACLANSPQLCTVGQNISLRSNPSRAGYDFLGWKVQDKVNVKPGGASHVVLDDEYLFYAQWQAIDYTISFNSVGGSNNFADVTKNIGEVLTMPNPGAKPHHSFAGWTNDSGVTLLSPNATFVVGARSEAFEAVWTPNEYRVVYDWQGAVGAPEADGQYTFGSGDMSLPAQGDRVRDGYNFAGWSTSPSGGIVSGFQPTADTVLYAQWSNGNYSLTFVPKGGSMASTNASVPRGSSLQLPTPTRAGFVFTGWYDAANDGNKIGAGGAVVSISASASLYAGWVQRSLYGVDEATLETSQVYTASSSSAIDTTLTHGPSSSSARVQIPAGSLADGTQINVRFFRDTQRQQSLISNQNDYVLSVLVSWLYGSGDSATVPDTDPNKPITVTLSNSQIKEGAMIYKVIGDQITELGRAQTDGVVTVELFEDPEIVIAITAPDAPQSVIATPGDQKATVSWSAPASNGGDSITGYTVTANTGETCTWTSGPLTCEVTGLTNGTNYSFSVVATNSIGDSSATSATATPVAPSSGSSSASPTPSTPGPAAGIGAVSDQTWIWTKRLSKNEVKVYIKFPEMGANYQINLQKNDGEYSRKMSKTINTTADTDLRVVGEWYYLVRTITLPGEGRYRIEVTQDGQRVTLNGADRPAVYTYR